MFLPLAEETMQLSTATFALDPVRQLSGSPEYVRYPTLPLGAGALAVSSGRSSSRFVLRTSPDKHLPSSCSPLILLPSPPVLSRVFARLTFHPPSRRWSSEQIEDRHPLSPSSSPPRLGHVRPSLPSLSMIAAVLENRPFASGGRDGSRLF